MSGGFLLIIFNRSFGGVEKTFYTAESGETCFTETHIRPSVLFFCLLSKNNKIISPLTLQQSKKTGYKFFKMLFLKNL